jgi:hypothetical protein
LLLSGKERWLPKIMEGLRAHSTLFFRQENYLQSLARPRRFLLLSHGLPRPGRRWRGPMP